MIWVFHDLDQQSQGPWPIIVEEELVAEFAEGYPGSLYFFAELTTEAY